MRIGWSLDEMTAEWHSIEVLGASDFVEYTHAM